MEEKLITTATAVALSGYHPEHIRRLLKEDRVKGNKFGFVWQINRKSFLSYLNEMTEKGSRRGPKTK